MVDVFAKQTVYSHLNLSYFPFKVVYFIADYIYFNIE